MNKITTIEIDADKVSLFNARLDKFGELVDMTSAKLPNYVEKIDIAAKRVHLETESLREIRESININIAETLKKEISALTVPLGNQLFATFSGKASTFLDGRFSAVNRANDDLKRTINTWSNLSFKYLSLLVLSAVFIGIFAFFVSYYFTSSQKFTETEIKCMYYGKAYVLHSEKFPEAITRIVAEEADRLMKR